jgi:hypothetical protein
MTVLPARSGPARTTNPTNCPDASTFSTLEKKGAKKTRLAGRRNFISLAEVNFHHGLSKASRWNRFSSLIVSSQYT